MGRPFTRLFYPLLLALLWEFGAALLSGSSVARQECLEMIGSEPKSFSGKQGLKFEANVLPKLYTSHSGGITVTFRIKVQHYTSKWNDIFRGGGIRTPSTWFNSGSTHVHIRVSKSSSYKEASANHSRGDVFNLKQWHHAAYILKDQKLQFYVDGKVVMTYTVKGKVHYPDGTQPFYIGYGGSYTSFSGQLKFFRYYDFALTKEQLNQDESSLRPITENDTGSDASGNSLEMIGSKPKSFNQERSIVFKPDLLPKFGASYASGLTITFKIMVKQYTKGCWNVIFHGGLDPFRTPVTWLHPSTTRVHPRVSTSTNMNEGGDSSGNVFTLNKWHHAAYVLTNKKLLFYVDGKVVMTYNIKGKVKYPDGTHPFYIGYDTEYYSFNGQLQFFRFYNFVLSSEQIKQDGSSDKPITETKCCSCTKGSGSI